MENSNIKYITMQEVVDLLGLDSQGKPQFNTFCPYCDGDKRKKHLAINTLKGVFNCPKCESGGSALGLYAFFTKGIEPKKVKEDKALKSELAREIRQKQGQLGYKPEMFEYQERTYEQIDVEPTDIEHRSFTYEKFLSVLPLCENHMNDLLRRGFSPEEIAAKGYKSTPQLMLKKIPVDLRLAGCDLLGVPGFYQDEDIWKIKKTTTGYFVPVRDLKGRIQGMQIRADNDKASKYMWFSSANETKGSGAKTWCHFVGYPEKEVFLTEGPLKADLINKFSDKPCIAVPGVNALIQLEPLLVELKQLGVKKILTAFDMDFITNQNVQRAYDKLILLIEKIGLEYEKILWDPEYKGYDDFLYNEYKKNNG